MPPDTKFTLKNVIESFKTHTNTPDQYQSTENTNKNAPVFSKTSLYTLDLVKTIPSYSRDTQPSPVCKI